MATFVAVFGWMSNPCSSSKGNVSRSCITTLKCHILNIRETIALIKSKTQTAWVITITHLIPSLLVIIPYSSLSIFITRLKPCASPGNATYSEMAFSLPELKIKQFPYEVDTKVWKVLPKSKSKYALFYNGKVKVNHNWDEDICSLASFYSIFWWVSLSRNFAWVGINFKNGGPASILEIPIVNKAV